MTYIVTMEFVETKSFTRRVTAALTDAESFLKQLAAAVKEEFGS